MSQTLINFKLKLFLFIVMYFSLSFVKNQEINIENENYFSPDILEKYAEYVLLEEYTNTCNYEKFIDYADESSLKEKIVFNLSEKNKNCVPDSKSLIAMLENGWKELIEFLIKEVYFPKMVDASQTIMSYINKSQSKLRSLVQFLKEYSKSNNLLPEYNYENFDDRIKFTIAFPDASYVPEYISIFCYKDSFKINSIVKSKNKLFRLNESKSFFDKVTGECEHTFNSFNNQIEISVKKLNKLKKWDKLFKD